jgi:autotransporter-associated beta strand protein
MGDSPALDRPLIRAMLIADRFSTETRLKRIPTKKPMKSKSTFPTFLTVAGMIAVSGVCQTAKALNYTWDLDTTAGIQTGSGTWNTTDTNWSTTGISDSGWLQTSATVALHAATLAGVDAPANTYDITLGTNLAAQKLTFSNSGYTLSAAAPQTLVLTETGNGLISVASGKSATIGNNVRVNLNVVSNTGTRIDLTTGGTLEIPVGGTVTRTGGIASGGSASGGTLGFMGSGTVNVAGTLSFQVATPHTNGGIVVAANASNNNIFNVNGGTVSSNSNFNGVALVAAGTSGTLNLNSGLVSTTGTAGVNSGINLANGAGTTGTVNLDGGTISTYQVNSNYINASNVLTTGGTSIFNFHGGTLKAIANNTAFMGGLTNAFVKSNGAKFDSNGFNITVSQALLTDPVSTGGGLTKQGNGTLTLTGASTYTGATQVSGGALALNGSLTSNLIIDGGASITGTGSTTGTLTTSTGSTLIGSTAGDMLIVSGGVNFAGNTSLVFDEVLTSGNTYDVVNYGAGALSNLSNLTATARGTVTNDVPNTKVTFTAGSSGTRTWNVTNGTWEIGGASSNWVEGDMKFFNGDSVVFNNPVSEATVTLNGNLLPDSVSVDNTNGYVFSGSGSITGTAGLSKLGSGTLLIDTINTYTGGTDIQNGAISLSGQISNSGIFVNSGASLNTTSSGTITGSSSLSISGTVILASSNPYTGSTTIEAGGSLQLGDGSTDGSIPGTSLIFNDGSLTFNPLTNLTVSKAIAGSGSLTKLGVGTLTLSTASTYSGDSNINAGTLALSGTGTLGSGAISVASGATLDFSNSQNISVAVSGAGNINQSGGGTVTITGDFSGFTGTYTHNSSLLSSVFNTATATSAAAAYVIATNQGSQQGMIAAGTGDYTLQLGSLSGVANSLFRGGNFATGTTTLEVGALGTDTIFSGIIANGLLKTIALTKVGAGTLTLEGLNTYTGNTAVTGGALTITQDDVFNDDSTLTLANAKSLNLTHSGTDKVATLIINGVTQGDGLYTFGTGKIQIGPDATPFQTWAISKGLDGTAGKENGLADDPDNDGSTNLAEFAFNGNPLSGSDNGQIYVLTADSDDVGTDKELILTLAVRKTTPAFTAGAPATAPLTDGVNYSVHGSTDLASFGVTVTPVGFVDPGVALTDATNYEYRSFSLDGSNGLAGKGFLRAKAEAP